MQACFEITGGIVRVGPLTDAYGKPFDFAVAVSSVDGKTAVVKALTKDERFTIVHARTIISKLKEYFEAVTWDRFNNEH